MRRGADGDELCPARASAGDMAAAAAAACRKLRREVRPKSLLGDSVWPCDIGILLLWRWKTADNQQQMIRRFEKEGKTGNCFSVGSCANPSPSASRRSLP